MDIVLKDAAGKVTNSLTGLPNGADPALLVKLPNGEWRGIEIPPGEAFTVEGKLTPPPVILTTTLPAAKVGVAYSTTLTASGGTPPYYWVATGLPLGLSASITGTISGTPTVAGAGPVTLGVRDVVGLTAEHAVAMTVAPADPPPTSKPTMPVLPAGYKVWKAWTPQQLGSQLHRRTGNQGGTESVSKADNVYYDPAIGALRLRTRVEQVTSSSGTFQYSSAYADLGSSSTNESERFPLECRVRVLARYPLAFSAWACAWLNAYGAADNFEIDWMEIFTGQAPGYNNVQVHSPVQGGKNLIRGKGDGSQGTTVHAKTVGVLPLAKGVKTGTQRAPNSVQAYAFDRGDGPMAIPGHTGVHLGEVETSKVPNGMGWSLQVRFWYDGNPLVSYVTQNAPDTAPSWFKAGTEQRVWDFRLDHWVGGDSLPRATVGGKPIFVYDGKNKEGTSQYLAPVGTVPNADLWIADPKASYFYDVFGMDILVKA